MDQTSSIDQLHEETAELLNVAAGSLPAERAQIEARIVELHIPLAHKIALRYANRGIDLEDLRQVACLALVKALRRFDPERGEFHPFAAVTVSGELKKHFRDHGWMVRPPRRIQQLQGDVGRVRETMLQRIGAEPTQHDLAAALGVDVADVNEAQSAFGYFSPTSIDAPARHAERSLKETLADPSDDFRTAQNWLDLTPAWQQLSDDERRLLELRFFKDMTQSEIANAFGVSQMQISRRLATVLAKLRNAMGEAAA